MNSKVSFTIRPPTTSTKPSSHISSSSRPSSPRKHSFIPHEPDSSDEDDDDEQGTIEAVTGYDQSGAQRLHEKPKPAGPLVIPALANRDWRAVARLRKQQTFIPDGTAVAGRDGSQGGLGTRDTINSGVQAAGLVILKRGVSPGDVEHHAVKVEPREVFTLVKEEENEDDRARRALLASIAGGTDEEDISIDVIPLHSGNYSRPIDETDAYKQDIVTRPDSATLADYERVPVSQFGAALLRGMGWKEGTAASRTRPGLVEPWLPPSRPNLLGIGAKERPQEDIPSFGKGSFANKRPEKRYVPVVKLQKEGAELPPPSRSRSRSPVGSRTQSRVPSSKSASPYPKEEDKNRIPRQRDHDRVQGDRGYSGSRRGSDRESTRDSDRDRDRPRHKERERDREERTKEHRRERERDRDDGSRKLKEYRRDAREGGRSRDRGDRY